MVLAVSSPLRHRGPEDWAKTHASLGLGAVNFHLTCEDDPEVVDAYVQEAERSGLVMAEVGIWRNTLAPDEDGPDQYLELLEAVDRDRFAVHLDVFNWMTSPKRYFYNEEFVDECFEKLGKYTRSCHLKDVRLEEHGTSVCSVCLLTDGPLEDDEARMKEAGFAPVFKQEKGYEAYEYFDAAKVLGVLVELKEQY